MDNATRILFNRWLDRVATLNGVGSAREAFTITPTVQQTLEAKIQESSEFLSQINVYGVPELVGQKLGMGITQRIATRTDMSLANARRNPRDPSGLTGRGYQLAFTEFDTSLPYAKLDQWAKFPNFQQMLATMIAQAIALDRITIGFNGIEAKKGADKSDPLLTDVNKGWLQYIREEAAERVFDEGAKTADKIVIGADAATTDYRTIDALVYDAVHSHMPTWGRKRNDLVAITSGELLHDKYMPLINKVEKPTEQQARDIIMSTKRVGGRPGADVPFFPDGSILVTPLKNLSIYYQDGKRRRHIREEPELNRAADYQSSNEGYVVEDLDCVVLIENIELAAGAE